MQDDKRYGVLTDAQWAGLAPLIEAVRPHGKTEPRELGVPVATDPKVRFGATLQTN